MSLYRLIVFLHVFSSLLFFAAHGISMLMIFKVRRERNLEKLCEWLEISAAALRPAGWALRGVELTGIILTIWAGWYRMGWIWLSLALFVAVGFVMVKYGAGYMNSVRRAMGMPVNGKLPEKPMFAPPEQLAQIVAQGRPKMVLGAAMSLSAAIVALMVLKPF